MVIISQSPANIEDDIRKNSLNLFVFRLQDPWDIKVIAGMFGYVHVDEVNYLSSLLSSLDERNAIVKTPLMPSPFLIRTLDLNFESISQEEMSRYYPAAEEPTQHDFSEDESEFLKRKSQSFNLFLPRMWL